MKPKLKITSLAILLVAAMLTGCEQKENEEGSAAAILKAAAAAPNEPDPGLPEQKIELTGNDQMKFNIVTIEARPRQKVTVTLKNIGTMPKVSMGHNFVLLSSDMDPTKFVEVSGIHMARDFIAPELETKVIAHTRLLGPTESDTITFAAPAAPGEYPFICSFPGHCAIGMKGVLTVR